MIIAFQLCDACAAAFRRHPEAGAVALFTCETCKPRLDPPTLAELARHVVPLPDLPTRQLVERVEQAEAEITRRILGALSRFDN